MNAYVVCKLRLAQVKTRDFLKKLVTDENGDTNFVSIILICVVVIAIAALFKEKLESLVGDIFDKLSSFVSSGDNPYSSSGE